MGIFFRDGLKFLHMSFFHTLAFFETTKEFSKKRITISFIKGYITSCILFLFSLSILGGSFHFFGHSFEWHKAFQRIADFLIFGFFFGLIYGIFSGLPKGLVGGILLGAFLGLAAGLGEGLDGKIINIPTNINTEFFVIELITGLSMGLIAGVAFGLIAGLTGNIAGEMASGLAAGLIVFLILGLTLDFLVAGYYLIVFILFFYRLLSSFLHIQPQL